MQTTHITENLADIGAFVRTASREIQRADARLRTSVWRKETQYRLLTRTDYVIARLHLDRAHRILQSLDRHVKVLEEQEPAFFFEGEAEPARDAEPDFYNPYADTFAEERLSQRIYDV